MFPKNKCKTEHHCAKSKFFSIFSLVAYAVKSVHIDKVNIFILSEDLNISNLIYGLSDF